MAINPLSSNTADEYLAKPRGDNSIQINQNMLLALLVSVALHVLLLWLILPKINLNTALKSTTIDVSLASETTAKAVKPTNSASEKKSKSEIKKRIIAQKPTSKANKPKSNDFSIPKTMSTPEASQPQVPLTPKEMPQTPSYAPTDMASYVAQQRLKREAGETDASRQNAAAVAAEQDLSEDAKRDARIKNNFNNGTNGIFEITGPANLNAASPNARFTFLGWTSSVSNPRREFFEVEAISGQDVRLVMIKKMISSIRLHYQGDFNWESHRLNRAVVLSARIEDSEGLEEFMMMEFFGAKYKTSF